MTTPTPVRFQQFLDLIHYYLDKRGEYQEHIQYFQDELSEEMYLKEILESFDEREFQNLKDSIESFLENYKEEVKESHDSLDNLAIQLKEIIHHNNRLINKNKTLEKFYQQYGEQTKLTTQRVRAIEDKITDIYQILQDNDRNTNQYRQTLQWSQRPTSQSHLRCMIPKISLPIDLKKHPNISHLDLFKEEFSLTKFKLTVDFSWCPADTKSGGVLAILGLQDKSEREYQLEISSPSTHYGKSSLHLYLKQEGKAIHHGSILEYTGSDQNSTQNIHLEISLEAQWNLTIGNQDTRSSKYKIPPIQYRGDRYTFESWLHKKKVDIPNKLSNIALGTSNALSVIIRRLMVQSSRDSVYSI